MKRKLLTALLASLGPLFWIGLGAVDQTSSATGKQNISWADSADPALAEIVELGEKNIERVGGMLVGEVNWVLSKNRPGRAADMLHLRNFAPLKPVEGQPTVTAIKRTSLRVRNPANAPDDADLLALNLINARMNDGEAPPSQLVQRIEQAGQPTEWRVYRPIGVSSRCLICHGDVEQIPLDVQAVLELRYPQDRATGYTSNQWRGVIRISLEKPAPPAAK